MSAWTIGTILGCILAVFINVGWDHNIAQIIATSIICTFGGGIVAEWMNN